MPIIFHTFYAQTPIGLGVTGGLASFRMPSNYLGGTVTFELWGACGASSSNVTSAKGGLGGRIKCDIPFDPLDQIVLEIGSRPIVSSFTSDRNKGGFNTGGIIFPTGNAGGGCGGGGRSAVWRNGLLKAVAGAGGGGGMGDPTTPQPLGIEGSGGDGGYPQGTGGIQGVPSVPSGFTALLGGAPGTDVSGGAGGTVIPIATHQRNGQPGGDPSVNLYFYGWGGDGAKFLDTAYQPGAGGGGYAGGGSGCRANQLKEISGGGGGGSSWVAGDVSLISHSTGVWNFDGKISMTYGVS